MYLIEVGACDLQWASSLIPSSALLLRGWILLLCLAASRIFGTLSRRSRFPASALSVCRRNLISLPDASLQRIILLRTQKKPARRTALYYSAHTHEYLCCFLRDLSHALFPRNAKTPRVCVQISEIALSAASSERRHGLFFLTFFAKRVAFSMRVLHVN